jgi:TonB-linked SusC/RagA family outer membrane protein
MDLTKQKKDRLKNTLLNVVACMLFLIPSGLFAQAGGEVTVKGQVTDIREPLAGVTIMVQGTSRYATTDVDGNYSITAPNESSVLVFTSLGYKTVNETVGTRSIINVVLEEEAERVDELVVIGYGTQRKEAVTGSVASVTGAIVKEVPSANISYALQGRVAGVEMSQTSTKPGAEMQIRIRGKRSLSATNDPLVVLDGIPFIGTLGDINPNDIKSIDILKDASATAIYGSRGANGVLMVTTNKGVAGQKPQVNYNGYVGVKTLFARFPMMEGPEYVKLRKIAGTYTTNGLDEADDVNTDWQGLLFRNGIVTSHDVGISGGTDKGAYNFGVGYYRDEALIPLQNYNRLSLRGSFDQEIGKLFRFGITTNNSHAITNGANLSPNRILDMSPITNPWNADGTWKQVVEMVAEKNWADSQDVLEGLGAKYKNQTLSFASYNNLYGELKIPGIEGLKYRMNVGLNYRTSKTGSYTGEGVFSNNVTNESSASVSNELYTNWAIENLITFDRTFAEKHQINVVGLYSAEQTTYSRSQMSARDIPADFFQYYNIGRADGAITVDPAQQRYWQSGLMSWMGRVMYSYDNRYMLSATIRSDASSRLAPGYKWHTYPAVSAGWNISKESFMQNITQINALKLRVGYGQTSNQAVDPYATLGLLATRPYSFGDTGYATGYYVSQLPNTNLGWEYSTTLNFALDFSLLNNRLSGTFEYYVQNTEDILMSVDLPTTSGVGTTTQNIGESQNKGFELSLNGVILDNYKGWTWEVGFNLYANQNKLLSLSSGSTRDEGNWWFVGYPIDVIYDYQKIGLWQDGDQYLQIYEPGGNVGMIKVKYTGDYNADGSPTRAIGTADRQIIKVDPKFQGGFNTRVTYKGFDFSIVGAFKSGGTLISSLYSISGYLNPLTGRRGQVKADYWTPENTGAKYPKPGGMPAASEGPKYGSTLGYFDASYLKIRTITLGYTFDVKALKDIGIGRLRAYVTVQNPFVLFSPYYNESGMDPETNSYANENASVTTAYQPRLLSIGTNTPATRNYLFGLNITF